MKFKFIAVFSIIVLCFVNSFAQERNFEIEISMEETNISGDVKEIPVKVKITNKAEMFLLTGGLGSVHFQFSECLIRKDCIGRGKTYFSGWNIPEKGLRQNESIEFEVDLLKMGWLDGTSSYIDANSSKSFRTIVSNKAIYFQAFINLPAGYKMDKTINRKIPISKSFRSNTIAVVIE